MKITSSKEEQKFEPITFNITVESKEELQQLKDAFGKGSANCVTLAAYNFIEKISKNLK